MRHPIVLFAFLSALLSSAPATAQSAIVGADLFFYGDNTEFVNPFRSGDTTLGTSGRVFLDLELNHAVAIRGGFFALGRFGSHEALEHAEPVIALQVTRGASRFIFGSLETIATRSDVAGPDEETPHRLLPPLQQEQLSFTRGQEMGLQWIVTSPRLDHDAWLNWQRLNTSTHRERFDAGYRAGLPIGRSWRFHGQWHVVHEGGQRFNSGAVNDSQGGAVGAAWSRALTARARFDADAHVVGTRHVPDRARRQLTETGIGIFTRAAVTRGAWRSHLIVWRARDTLKAEGDANYLALRRDGEIFHKVRDYAEWGLTRHFRPASELHMFAAVRIHRVESHYEYSYRIVGRVRLRHKVS